MSKQLTSTQVRAEIIKELLDTDEEFRTQMRAYADLVEEFGNVKPPVYLQEKLNQIEDIVKGRVNSNSLIQ